MQLTHRLWLIFSHIKRDLEIFINGWGKKRKSNIHLVDSRSSDDEAIYFSLSLIEHNPPPHHWTFEA